LIGGIKEANNAQSKRELMFAKLNNIVIREQNITKIISTHIGGDDHTSSNNVKESTSNIKGIKTDNNIKETRKCPPMFEYNGKTYHTVNIGSQCWMKENLDIGTMISKRRIPKPARQWINRKVLLQQ